MDIRWIRSIVLVNLSMDLAGCYPCLKSDIHGPDPWILQKKYGILGGSVFSMFILGSLMTGQGPEKNNFVLEAQNLASCLV